MPWDAHAAAASRRSTPDGTLGESAPRRRRPGRVDRPARVVAGRRRSTSSPTGAAGGTCTGSVDGPRLEPLAPMEAEFADPGLGLRPLDVRRSWPTARSSPSAGAAAATGSSGSSPAGSSARSRLPFTELEASSRSTATIVAVAGAAGRSGRASLGSTRRRWRRPASCAGRARSPPTRRHRRARADRVPDDRRPDRARALLPADATAAFARPGRRAAAAHRHEPRRPDRRTPRPALDLAIQLLTSRGFAVARRRLRRQHRLRPATTGSGSTGEWGVVDVDDCVAGGALPGRARAIVDGDRLAIAGGSAGGYTTLARARVPRRVRGRASATSASATSRRSSSETHKFESRYLDRLVGPYPEAAELYRERSPLHFSTGSRARS